MTTLPKGPLVAWVGDDFTGSAATMEVLEFAGLPSVLFLDTPDAAMLARFPDARGIGIATTARSHSPDWMDGNLPPIYAALAATGAPVVHYKVCSTLDSAPHVGSIGRAIDLGRTALDADWVPCLIAAPTMRRYQAFGHLFAGTPDGVFRLDRHPVMSRHPVTPMTDSDVARHLSAQTDCAFAVLTVEDLARDPDAALQQLRAAGAEVVTLDAMTEADMTRCGALIWPATGDRRFAVGSQGVEYALVGHWRAHGLIPSHGRGQSAGAVERLLAVSGSVSPITAAQIAFAETNGFAVIRLDVAAVVRGDTAAEDKAVATAKDALAQGRDPLICSARGPDDPAIGAVHAARDAAGLSEEAANARIGAALGRCLKRLLHDTGIRRAVISGGDTSGHAARQLDIYAVTALAPTIPGAALLAAHSDDPALAGLQLALKGGQMGSPDYFGWIKRGGGTASKG